MPDSLVQNPFEPGAPRPKAVDGIYSAEEVQLANRNSGALLETLAQDITPAGTHYLLSHFDVPILEATTHKLEFSGAFSNPFKITLKELQALPQISVPVTLECAGNGRAGVSPRNFSMPWMYEAVGTALWTGTPLAPLIERASPLPGVEDFAFIGADKGFDKGVPHHFGRSLTPEEFKRLDVLLVWGMNGEPLLPQHGAPLRMIVPGWYGMASVKWLTRIEALTRRYEGFQQVETYRYRTTSDEAGTPVTGIRVKSLMRPPGVPDWVTRKRWVAAGQVELSGRAWSGDGVEIASVEVLLDGEWREAELLGRQGKYAWTAWRINWNATPGRHILACRATDANGSAQPLEAPFDRAGFGNNSVHRLEVHVSAEPIEFKDGD